MLVFFYFSLIVIIFLHCPLPLPDGMGEKLAETLNWSFFDRFLNI
jgi:hypothetical protein